MHIKTNLTDLSKITLDNYKTYNEKIEYEIPRQWGVRNIKQHRRQKRTEEDRKQYLKQYQHEYYLRVTKPKRKSKGG